MDAQADVPPAGLTPDADAEWDAGDMGCGELILRMKARMAPLLPGQVFKLTARDLGAPEDMPAWCRLTRHVLLRAAHPHYWIQKRS